MEHQSLADATVSLIRVRPDRNERRFYALAVDVDLFNCALLVRCWGRLGTSGRTRLEAQQSVPAALDVLATLERTKRRRGYWSHGVDVLELPQHDCGDEAKPN
jgi:predicted DNA-binding WGR domain protein